MPDSPIIALRDLRFEIGGRTILSLAAWQLPRGKHALVLGPSGVGKTTLLHLLAALLRPTSGALAVAGADLCTLKPAACDRWRGAKVGIVFQRLHLISAVSVLDNLRLARSLAGRSTDEGHLWSLLAGLGLSDVAHRRPRELSFGEAQRVAIARAAANRPELLLADEPTAALDDANTERVADMLAAQAETSGASLVVATHDKRLIRRFEERLELTAVAS